MRILRLSLLAVLPITCFATAAICAFTYAHVHAVTPTGAAMLPDLRAALYLLSVGFTGYGVLALFPLACEAFIPAKPGRSHTYHSIVNAHKHNPRHYAKPRRR